MADRGEPIRALATIILDAGVLEQLGPQAIDRLADAVEARLAGRRPGGRGASGPGELLSVSAVAAQAGVSPSLVYREIERGRLSAYRVGTRLRVDPAAVEGWRERCRVRPRSERPMYEPMTRGNRRAASASFVDELDAIERHVDGAA